MDGNATTTARIILWFPFLIERRNEQKLMRKNYGNEALKRVMDDDKRYK